MAVTQKINYYDFCVDRFLFLYLFTSGMKAVLESMTEEENKDFEEFHKSLG